MITDTYPAITTASAAVRICPTCRDLGVYAPMIQVSARAWICPNQNDVGNGISPERRESIKHTADARVANLPF